MPRTIKAQAIVYTMIDPEKEDYKQVRRMNNVALEADVTADQAKQFAQIVADAKAFVKDGVKLYATPTGAKMTETQVTEIYHVDEKKEPQPAEPQA